MRGIMVEWFEHLTVERKVAGSGQKTAKQSHILENSEISRLFTFFLHFPD